MKHYRHAWHKGGKMSRYGSEGKYNSLRDDYMTPESIYKPLLEVLGRDKYDIDVCSTRPNIPANINYTKNENGLLKPWSGLCFCNPPWKYAPAWIKKGASEIQKQITGNTEVVFVIPSNRMETAYMQEHILNNPNCVWFIIPQKQGFIIPEKENEPPIPSVGVAVAIMSQDAEKIKQKLQAQNPFKTSYFIGQRQ